MSIFYAAVKRLLDFGLHPFGYRIIKPSNHFGIDPLSDVSRICLLRGMDIGVVFDVGANIGLSTLNYTQRWPGCRVFAFEPNPTIVRELAANVGQNGAVRVEQLALGSSVGSAIMHTYKEGSDLSSLGGSSPYANHFGLQGSPITVDVTTLDAFCTSREIAEITFLKIDTEGFDYDVLKGAERMLSEKRVGLVYCEFNTLSADADARGSLVPIADLLHQKGYSFVASYNDYIVTDGQFFAVSNALFVADRDGGV